MLGVNLALVVVGASLALTTSVAPSSPAAAVAVTVGPIEAQMANHRGTTVDTSARRRRQLHQVQRSRLRTTRRRRPSSPIPNEALTAHGKDGNFCPGTLDTSTQSAIGFRPSPITTVDDGVQFLIGRMVHYNNPIQATDRYFVGAMNVRLGGFDGDPTLDFPWTLDETPNQGSSPERRDRLQQPDLADHRHPGRAHVPPRHLRLPARPASRDVPGDGTGNPVNQFSTVEGTQTHACLYASLQQDRSPLTIVKQVIGTPPPARTFGFTSSSSLAGSAWSNGSFSLAAGGHSGANLTSGETVTVTETDPERRSLDAHRAHVHPDRRQRPAPARPGDHGQPGRPPGGADERPATAEPEPARHHLHVHQHLHAQGDAHPGQAGRERDGGTVAVDADRHRARRRSPGGRARRPSPPSGSGPAPTRSPRPAPARPRPATCRRATGSADGRRDERCPSHRRQRHADGQRGSRTRPPAVTCTVTNRLAPGSLQISKVVDAPAGAYTGGTTKTFAGTYNCGTGFSGSVQHADHGDRRS